MDLSGGIDNKLIMGAILKTVAPEFEADDATLGFITDRIVPVRLNKGEFFLKAGELSDRIGIIINQDALLKAYSFNEDSEKVISHFFHSPEYMVVSNFESFNSGEKSEEFIEAVSDLVLLQTISKENLELIYKEVPAFNIVGRVLAEKGYLNANARLKEARRMDGKELVENLFNKRRELFKQVGKGELASYLGMSRNKFSDILKEINKKGGPE